ncbi:MAG TPA: potassium channel family protein [Solirubrobacteraceae bacterium]|jgi:hypothetical protein
MRALDRLRASPLKWAVLYLVLAPIFATWYAFQPEKSFHDSNIEFESSLERDARSLARELTPPVRARATEIHWSTSINGGVAHEWLVPGTIHVAAIRHTNNQQLLLDIEGEFTGQSAVSGEFGGGVREWVQVIPDESYLAISPPGIPEPSGAVEVGYPVSLTESNGGPTTFRDITRPPVSILFPFLSRPAAEPPSSEGLLAVSKRLDDKIVRLYRAMEGDPSYASGLWWRMFYFSATTITTLGLGDLTPVSQAARISVAVEALAGIVLIGLFLNGLAGRLRKARDSRTESRRH